MKATRRSRLLLATPLLALPLCADPIPATNRLGTLPFTLTVPATVRVMPVRPSTLTPGVFTSKPSSLVVVVPTAVDPAMVPEPGNTPSNMPCIIPPLELRPK